MFIREKTRKNDAGFPTKFAECVTAGVGVITNDVSNIKDYFPLPNSFLLDSVDAESLNRAISDAVGIGKTKKDISKVFDIDNYVEKVNDFLEAVDK